MPRRVQVGYFLDGSETLEQVVLRLRYGSLDPVQNQIPIASMNCVSKYIHIPLAKVQAIVKQFFYAKYKAKGRAKMSDAVANLLISPEFLLENCTLSLNERAVKIARSFPNEPISASAIQRLYKKKQVKFKQVKQKRVSWREGEDELRKSKQVELIEELMAADDEGDFEIFQIDETVFIGADHMRKAWANVNDNLTIGLVGAQEQQKSIVIGAISSKGNYFYFAQPNYFKADDVVKFLKIIRSKMRNKLWAIFWDNCSTHRSLIVKEFLERYNIPVVFNLPYKPELNGIECLWSAQKSQFRKTITDKKINQEVLDVMKSVIDIQKETQNKKQMVKRITNYGWN